MPFSVQRPVHSPRSEATCQAVNTPTVDGVRTYTVSGRRVNWSAIRWPFASRPEPCALVDDTMCTSGIQWRAMPATSCAAMASFDWVRADRMAASSDAGAPCVPAARATVTETSHAPTRATP